MIFKNLPAEEYHARLEVSNSQLSLLKKSPLHLKAALDGIKEPPGPALILGGATHTAILEPQLFESQYCVSGQCQGITGKGSRCTFGGSIYREPFWYCKTHDPEKGQPISTDKVVLMSEEFDVCLKMQEAVAQHPLASELIYGHEAENELSFTWLDPDTGVECRGRADRVIPAIRSIVDLKTTRDASPEEFCKSIFNFGYHRQASFYKTGLNENEFFIQDFIFICVEKTVPYAVSVFKLSRDAMEAGSDQINVLLQQYSQCLRNDNWPGYTEQMLEITLPSWAWSKL